MSLSSRSSGVTATQNIRGQLNRQPRQLGINPGRISFANQLYLYFFGAPE